MSTYNGYEYADLSPELVEQLRQLEERLQAAAGQDITLIAFTRESNE